MLEAWLRTLFPAGSTAWQPYAACFTRLAVPAHATLLAEGDVARRAYFIEQGCLRVGLNKQGQDLTLQFFFEGQTVSSLESFHDRTPSLFSLQTIEPCVLWWISRADAYRLLRELGEQPQVRERLAGWLLARTRHYMAHCVAFIRDSPRQRYQALLREMPWVVQRVPQRYIASYLGISPVHLSRIKK